MKKEVKIGSAPSPGDPPNETDHRPEVEVPEIAGSELPESDASGKGHPASVTEEEKRESTTELFRRIDEIQGQAKDFENRYLRAIADLENYRKRSVREKEEVRLSATSAVIEDLLPVLDNMMLGLQSAERHAEGASIRKGFEMVLEQFRNVLGEHGVREIRPDGEPFDPNVHECVSHQPSADVEEGVVIHTVRVGYRLRERLVRPASVVVSSGKSAAEDSGESKETPS